MSHQLLHANTSFLAAFLGASIAAVAAALLFERLARRASAAARHAVVLAALLVPPVLFAAAPIGLPAPLPAAAPPGAVTIDLAPAAPPAAAGTELPCVLAMVWLAGVAFALLRTAAGLSRWREVAARAEVIAHPLFDEPYTLARSPEVSEPAVIGITDPVVVLPAGYDFTEDELQAVFAHELAHIARRDNLTALAVQLVCALFWFDPLHLLARRKLVELRERVCDDLVLARGCDAGAYVAALARSCESALAAHAVACMSRVNLQERMESIMTTRTRRRWPVSLVRLFIASAVTAGAAAFAAFAPTPELTAGETPAAAGYDFDVRVTPQEGGRFTVLVRIDSPDGEVSSVAVVRSAPDTRTISTTHGGKTYDVTVQLAADGSATAQFEVREGAASITGASKTFPAPAARPVRVGNVPNMLPPKVIHRVEPAYTVEAKAHGIAGIVIVELTITETGSVRDARVLKPLPYGLDQAALDAVRQWRFEPASIDGNAVPVVFTVTVQFRPE